MYSEMYQQGLSHEDDKIYCVLGMFACESDENKKLIINV